MRCPKKSSVFAILLWVAVILLGANVALADLKVSFVVPSSVNAGVTFPITVNVTNDSATAITFNKVAAGYALPDMKIKGPYEVDTNTRTLAAGASTSFSFNFRIFYGTGAIVPVAVFFAQDSYQNQNMKGGGAVGIKVN
ncbi:MAG: hypothetical protein FJ121_11595 [Deltaproteobacteria bacterium]|nr:hypothetical protein [Deltaproteobacteria bacterium]